MNTLIRTRSGEFTLDKCYTIDELRKLKDDGSLTEAVIPTSQLFSDLEKISLNKKQTELVTNGVQLLYGGLTENKEYRLFDENGRFLAVSEYTCGRLKLKKAFWS